MMKLTFVFMTAAFLNVSAKGLSQNISFSGKGVPLKQIFSEVEKQTGYFVSYTNRLLRETTPVSITASNMPLNEFLQLVFAGQPLKFTIDSRTILLSAKPAEPIKPREAPSSPPVKGRITDSTGAPLAGATVYIKKSKATAITGPDGSFSINAAPGDVLVISYVGYSLREIKLTNENIGVAMNIGLLPVVTQFQPVEVVNTGYQTISRERMTGSFSTINTKRLEAKLQVGLLTALEGQAAGMAITKEGKIEVRGRSTFLANADPLIVVDGFPISGGLETINPDNVESVTVLKDAVAASIYGARSSNGVIVITTKKAKKGKALQVSYKGSTGITIKPNLSYLNRTGSADYVDAEIEAYKSNSTNAQNTYDRAAVASRVYQLMIAKDRNQITDAQLNTELDQLRNNNGIDQMDEYLFRTKFTQQHNLSITSGNEKNMTNAAVRYFSNQNRMISDKDSRVIFDLKNDWRPVSRVNIRLFSNINFNSAAAPVRTSDELLGYSSGSMIRPYNLIVDPTTGQPQNIPVVRPALVAQYANIKGLKPMDYNPLNDLTLEMTRSQNFQARLGAQLSVNILTGLSADVGGLWTRGSAYSRTIYDANSYRMRSLFNATTSASNPTKHYIPDGAAVDEYRNINESYTFRGQINFNKTISSKHRVSAIAGGEINKDVLDYNSYPTRYGYNDQAGSFSPFNYADYSSGLYNSDFQLPGGWTAPSTGSYTFRDNRFVSVYANGSYEYDNRFLVSGSVRIDQTNFFGTNPKYRYKPNWSIGGTYKLSQEKFFHVPWIDKMNIRGSYGINGNISLKQGPYLLITPGTYTPIVGAVYYSISSPPNNDLRWERTQITNVGTDLSLFNRKLNITFDYYNKLSKDLLAPDVTDATYGRVSVIRNAGTARNTGFELSLETDIIRNKSFGWNVLFNGSYNRSKVVNFNYNYAYTSYLTLSGSASLFGGSGGSTLRTDYPLDALFSYRFAGLNNTGTPTYYTNDKTPVLGGVITVNDLAYSGTVRPKYVLGLTNTFNIHRFDVSFLLVGQMGGVFRKDTYYGSNYNNKYVAQRWQKPGDEATTIYPRLNVGGTDAWYYPYTDVLVESSNFVKLRDVTLTYSLNDKIFGRSGFNNARVYFQGRNLLMVTANKDNIDPETMVNSDGSVVRNLPLKPELYVGLSINF